MGTDLYTQDYPDPFRGASDWSGATRTGSEKFPNPFFDIASDYIPRNLYQIFEWAEYIYLTYGTYRSAARKVVRYFLTEVVLDGGSEDDQEQYKDFLNNDLHIMTQLADVGDDYMCFHGDTLVPTRNGVYKIRDLVDKDVDIISQEGVYRKAHFKSYGRQSLMEVTLSDGRTLLATPEHQWVALNCSGKKVRVPTTQLTQGYRIERTVAARPPKGKQFREGVRHGFIYGDGSVYNKTRKTPMSVANLFGAKDAAVMPYFDGLGGKRCVYPKQELTKIHGFPASYKQLPANDASAEYWYGFLCGFLAADGSVDVYGCPLLTQVSKTALTAIVEQLPRIGMVAGPIREYTHHSVLDRGDNSKYTFDGSYCVVALLKRFMHADDFLVEAHRLKFLAQPASDNYGKFVGIKSVYQTGIVDNVFCCVEPETNTFVVGNGVLTGNCYGNVFVSIYFPFDRYLICKKCDTHYHIDTIAYRFQFKDLTFHANCPKCGYSGFFDREDVRSMDKSRVKLIRWSPKRIRIRFHDISWDMEYFMEPDPRFVQKLSEGNRYFLNQTPWPLIECCANSGPGVPLFKFNRDSIYHMHEATLSGLPIRGWAIPPILPNFKLAYYIAVMRRYDEAIVLDFILPFRIFHPTQNAPGGMGTDPLQTMSMDVFMSQMQKLIQTKRKNITDIAVVPFPIEYKMLGGEAKSLSPKENIAQALDELLNAIGYPAELYRGSLSIQAFPVALRLFEKTWGTLVEGNNDLLSWIVKRISRYFGWSDDIKATLRSVTLADDIERKALSLQAAAGMDISKTTAYRPLGINFLEEQEKVVEEQKEVQKLQQEAMEEQEAAQAGAPGGAPDAGGAGGQPGSSPGDVNQQAKDLAYQLVTQTPENQRRGELIKIKQSNPTLHALVLQEMNNLRQQMASQGQAMMMQQAQQGQKTASAHDELSRFPSPLGLGLLISGQVMDYTRKDLRKIAMDIHRKVGGADRAFRFIFRKITGME